MATPPIFSSGAVLTAAQMNAVGLWKITTATATSGGTMNIASCFTSDYSRYRIVGTVIGNSATAFDLGMRFYAGAGAPAATGYYWGVTRVDVATGTSNVSSGNNSTYANIGAIAANNGRAFFAIDVVNPQLAQYTNWSSGATDSRSAAGYAGITASGTLSNTTQYDSVQFGYGIWGTGTIANLNVTVYGYQN